MLLLILAVIASLLFFVHADQGVYTSADINKYDRGFLGRTPAEHYKSFPHPSSRLLRRTWSEQCSSDEYFFLAPRGAHAPNTGPTIIDSAGHHVWFSGAFPTTYNFRAQTYKGEQYLTWWSGNDHLGGHGEGHYFMIDKYYQPYRHIQPHGDYIADLHEFTITRDDTALISIYDRIPWDLTHLGGTQNDSYIWDCLFQEIDIETNELLFEWRASEHFDFSDCHNPWNNQNEDTPGKDGWDWFHLNSVDKDDKGNYLISSRYTHSLICIEHKTGQVLWQLGGKNNSFTDLSDGLATGMKWQHHATWQDDFTAVTVYDNQAVNWNRTEESRGLKIRLDQHAMTAEVVAMATHPQHYIVHSQGSMSQLSNRNLFVGYGYAAAMTEFSADGKDVLCDWQFASLHALPRGEYSPGFIQNYRTYKLPWRGLSLMPPDVAIEDGMLYVSWNGATEHRKWLLEGSTDDEGGTWAQEVRRSGFETLIVLLQGEKNQTLRLTALDATAEVLGTWMVVLDEMSGRVNVTSVSRPPSSTVATPILTHYANIRFTYYALLGVIAMALCLILRRNKLLLTKTSVVYGVLGFS